MRKVIVVCVAVVLGAVVLWCIASVSQPGSRVTIEQGYYPDGKLQWQSETVDGKIMRLRVWYQSGRLRTEMSENENYELVTRQYPDEDPKENPPQ